MENEVVVVEEEAPVVDIKAIRAAFPNHAEFALDAIERGLSVIEAKAEFADVLLAQNAELAEQLAEFQAAVDEQGDIIGEIPVEYQESTPVEFKVESPEAEIAKLCKDAREQFGYSETEALNHVLKHNPAIADQLI
jgi:hypothetical protein